MEFPDTTIADNYRRRQMWALTAEERLQLGAQLNRHAMELLNSRPEAYQQYLKQNFRKRRHRPDMER